MGIDINKNDVFRCILVDKYNMKTSLVKIEYFLNLKKSKVFRFIN